MGCRVRQFGVADLGKVHISVSTGVNTVHIGVGGVLRACSVGACEMEDCWVLPVAGLSLSTCNEKEARG